MRKLSSGYSKEDYHVFYFWERMFLVLDSCVQIAEPPGNINA